MGARRPGVPAGPRLVGTCGGWYGHCCTRELTVHRWVVSADCPGPPRLTLREMLPDNAIEYFVSYYGPTTSRKRELESQCDVRTPLSYLANPVPSSGPAGFFFLRPPPTADGAAPGPLVSVRHHGGHQGPRVHRRLGLALSVQAPDLVALAA